MIEDIVFGEVEFILEMPTGGLGGLIKAYSLDGNNYDFTETIGAEVSSVFIN